MAVQSATIEVIHDKDPKRVIFDAVKGYVDDIEVNGVDILTVVYERPEKTVGGIIMPETSSARNEDKYQGIVALVVKTGPNIEKHAERFKDGKVPQVGDWVMYRTRDSDPFLMGKRTARLIEVQMVRAIVKRPDMVA